MNRKFSFYRSRRGAQHRSRNTGLSQPNGFTLMELLIVIAIILILMLMAIPTIGSLKKQANETSAIQSLHAISQAELQYESTYPANGYACSLAALGGDPNAGAPSPTASQMLQGDLSSGIKSGYIFTIGNCTKVNLNSTDRITGYQVTAVPADRGADRQPRLLQRPVRHHQVRPGGRHQLHPKPAMSAGTALSGAAAPVGRRAAFHLPSAPSNRRLPRSSSQCPRPCAARRPPLQPVAFAQGRLYRELRRPGHETRRERDVCCCSSQDA